MFFLCLKAQFRIPSTNAAYTSPYLCAHSPGWQGAPVCPQLLRLPWLLQDPHWPRCLLAHAEGYSALEDILIIKVEVLEAEKDFSLFS